ncbi:MAG: hypothetical protein ACRDOH_28150 [Streptosporangiaceae bacterium]
MAPCRQILVYPMLDDRNVVADPHLASFATWTYDNNFTAWGAVLGGEPASTRTQKAHALGG